MHSVFAMYIKMYCCLGPLNIINIHVNEISIYLYYKTYLNISRCDDTSVKFYLMLICANQCKNVY